jgi:mannitol/fructose-specific phosphotransferase system IIA component (Ntr-type)
MHPLANHLIQLQELALIREEKKVTGPAAHFETLDESIAAMKKELPRDIGVMFEKLYKKDHNVIIPISDGVCAVCGMSLPRSLVQAVRIGKDIHNCPNCARIIYYPESPPRRVGKAPRRTDPKKPGISRFSSHSLMIPKLESTDKEGAIGELAYKMEYEGFVDKADKLVEAALRREAILSTAFDHGLAFPHARGVDGGGLALVLGISRKGMKFGGLDKSLTRIIFFIAIPTAASAFYLKLLAGLTETFMHADARKTLTEEKDPERLWKALVRLTRSTIK